MHPFIHTKIYYRPGNQVRRFRLDTNTSLSSFTTTACSLFIDSPFVTVKSISEIHVQVLYLDNENEWISVNSENEWIDGMTNFIQTYDCNENVFRVKVLVVSKKRLQMRKNKRNEDLVIEKMEPIQLAEQLHVEAVVPDCKYKTAFNVLQNLGFKNLTLNAYLLNKLNGDVSQVVSALLEASKC
jgi:hypothetical protein